MSLIERGALSLVAFATLFTLYLVLRGIQNVREIALQAEEHQLLLQLPAKASDATARATYDVSLWKQYENARWLQRTQHLLAFSWPMQILLYGNFGRPSSVSRLLATKYSSLLLSQLQDDLRTSIPAELDRVVNLPDKRTAAREVARLVTMGFYAKLFDNWEQGEQVYQQALADPASQEKLTQLFSMVENAAPRLRNEALLSWVANEQ